MPARFFPFFAVVLVGLAHATAWRGALGQSAWVWLVVTHVPLLVVAVSILRKEETLGDLLRPAAGDMSKGILAAGLGVGAVYAIALAALKFAPATVGRDLLGVIRVAAGVSTLTRGFTLVGVAMVEELIWRGAATHALEGHVGSSRAPWIASGLGVLAALPSLHPSIILAAVVVGIATAATRKLTRRIVVPFVVHAFFSWITVEMVIPALWQRIQAMG